jgi:ATP-dependent helicase/nuclease subunit A
VFLADPCGGVGKWVDVHIKRDGKGAQGWFKLEKRSENSYAGKVLGEHADWETHKAAEEPFLAAEENRLLYVAATRAREMLVVSRYIGKGNVRNPAWGVLNGFLGAAQELVVPTSVAVAATTALPCSSAAQAEALATRVAAKDRIDAASWSITSVTAEAKGLKRVVPAQELASETDPTRVVVQNTSSHRADAGLAWGTLIHGLLEHAMRHKGATRDDLRRLAMWLTVDEPQLRSVMDQALDTVSRVATADFWQDAAKAEHSVETPFAMGSANQLTNGVVDLLFNTVDGWRVVDYKTDRTIDEGEYAQQLDAYRVALAAVACSVSSADVVSVRAGNET